MLKKEVFSHIAIQTVWYIAFEVPSLDLKPVHRRCLRLHNRAFLRCHASSRKLEFHKTSPKRQSLLMYGQAENLLHMAKPLSFSFNPFFLLRFQHELQCVFCYVSCFLVRCSTTSFYITLYITIANHIDTCWIDEFQICWIAWPVHLECSRIRLIHIETQ